MGLLGKVRTGVRRMISEGTGSAPELDAGEEMAEATGVGADLIAVVEPRSVHTVSGVLHAVASPPPGRAELVAELYDGSGTLDLVWTGRREIDGITPGRRLVARGRVSQTDPGRRRPMILNPRYRLLARVGR